MAIVSVTKKIRTGRAKRLVRNFKESKWREGDTRSIYFNQAFCNELIRELEKPEIDGFRLYFGAYEKNHNNGNRKDRMTVIFVTTQGGNNVLDKPDDPEQGPDKDENELPEEQRSSPFLEELNDGALCPPLNNCNLDPKNEIWP